MRKKGKVTRHRISGRIRLSPLFTNIFNPQTPRVVVLHAQNRKIILEDLSLVKNFLGKGGEEK